MGLQLYLGYNSMLFGVSVDIRLWKQSFIQLQYFFPQRVLKVAAFICCKLFGFFPTLVEKESGMHAD